MVKSTDLGYLHDVASLRWLPLSRVRTVLVEPEMAAGIVIVGEVRSNLPA